MESMPTSGLCTELDCARGAAMQQSDPVGNRCSTCADVFVCHLCSVKNQAPEGTYLCKCCAEEIAEENTPLPSGAQSKAAGAAGVVKELEFFDTNAEEREVRQVMEEWRTTLTGGEAGLRAAAHQERTSIVRHVTDLPAGDILAFSESLASDPVSETALQAMGLSQEVYDALHGEEKVRAWAAATGKPGAWGTERTALIFQQTRGSGVFW
jgi:hypothetical protein